MASSFSHLTILLLHSFFFTSISSTTIPIQPFNQVQHSDPYQALTHLASSSIARAHKIKNTTNAPAPVSTTPIQPFSGGYSISLSFGTPPQTIPMIMDTGSSFSWFPCTKRYTCKDCSSKTNISSFIPKQSSTARVLGCMNPKCSWVHKSFDSKTSCQDCLDKTNCTQICPPYIILYGLGSTGGVPMVETLHLDHQETTNFVVGCSIFSSNQPAGVAGFGRGASSIPNQLGIKKFSYCLVSHKFDNSVKTSWLKLEPFSDSGKKTGNFSYTRLLKNPVQSNSALSEYYYVGLKRIEIGGKKVEVLNEILVPDTNGNGGTIVDSGSTFTYMNQAVFDAVSNAFVEQVKDYKRAKNVEALSGLTPCFDVTGRKDIRMPGLELHFKGGAKMKLPLENVFIAVDDGAKGAVCLAMVTDGSLLGPDAVSGPSVILGNFLMQNFEVEYDLRNERFGYRQQFCS